MRLPWVYAELKQEDTPIQIRTWLDTSPAWLEIHVVPSSPPPAHIHAGEAEAIALAKAKSANLILLDDRDAFSFAVSQGLSPIGTLAVLRDAAISGFVDLADAFVRLKATNFRATLSLYDQLLAQYDARRKN
jgi:predicted nucleic acid-binding protein